MEDMEDKISECLQEEEAFCTAACPFRLDVRDFVEKMRRGSFNAAYNVYRNAVGFPEIVAGLCPEPCRNVCPRRDTDEAIDLRLLEKASVAYAKKKNPADYNVPAKNKKIAVIGAGISGLGCALRLSRKKYKVTVYEKSGRIGGQLWEKLPPQTFLADIEQQFQFEEYTLCLNHEITDLDALHYDAIYVATGEGGTDFGLNLKEGVDFESTRTGVFMGGSLIGKNTVEAIADGLYAANAIERFIKTGSVNQPEVRRQTYMRLDPTVLFCIKPVKPENGVDLDPDEAIREAERCLKCACDACMRHCDLMGFYKKYPKRIRDEVAATIQPASLTGQGTIAKRFIGSCNQCGLCKEICPKDIDMGVFLLESRRKMQKNGSLPWAYHDFWLRDMEAAMGESAHVALTLDGHEKSTYAFFPGCQLGASDPNYVIETYRFLLKKHEDTALWLSCCGAPAVWAGDMALQEAAFEMLRTDWENLGRPIVIFACPTCKQMFARYLSDMRRLFLYDLIDQTGFIPKRDLSDKKYSIFDPCSSRQEPELQQVVRKLSRRAGAVLDPLLYEGDRAKCCGWGGHVSIANPPYAKLVTEKRIAQSDNPYITYCVNCRDSFSSMGKPSFHILDILFDLNDENRTSPNITERRKNRARLKRDALKEFFHKEAEMKEKDAGFKLAISDSLKKKLGDEMLLEEDIVAAVEFCEDSGRKVVDSATGNFAGYAEIGYCTYWVEYRSVEDGFELINAYSHRMKIQLEEIWNGRKTSSDML